MRPGKSQRNFMGVLVPLIAETTKEVYKTLEKHNEPQKNEQHKSGKVKFLHHIHHLFTSLFWNHFFPRVFHAFPTPALWYHVFLIKCRVGNAFRSAFFRQQAAKQPAAATVVGRFKTPQAKRSEALQCVKASCVFPQLFLGLKEKKNERNEKWVDVNLGRMNL